MSSSTTPQNRIQEPVGFKETSAKDDRRRKLGLGIAVFGAVMVVPSILVVMFVDQLRGIGIIAALMFWFIWKAGRMIQRLHSGLQ